MSPFYNITPPPAKGFAPAIASILSGFVPRLLEKRKEERAKEAKSEEAKVWSKWLEEIPSVTNEAGETTLGELPDLVSYASKAPDPLAGAQYVRQLKGLESTGVRVGDRLELQRDRLEWQMGAYKQKDYQKKRDTAVKWLDTQGMLPAPGNPQYEPMIMNMMYIMDNLGPEQYKVFTEQMAAGPSPEEKIVDAPPLWNKRRMSEAWVDYYKDLGYSEADIMGNQAIISNIKSKVAKKQIPSRAAFPAK